MLPEEETEEENISSEDVEEDSVEEQESSQSDEDETEEVDGTFYYYEIPIEEVNGVLTPVYDEIINGKVHLHHTTPNKRYIIQEGSTPHYHKDDVNVVVREVDANEVVESDNKVRDFV